MIAPRKILSAIPPRQSRFKDAQVTSLTVFEHADDVRPTVLDLVRRLSDVRRKPLSNYGPLRLSEKLGRLGEVRHDKEEDDRERRGQSALYTDRQYLRLSLRANRPTNNEHPAPCTVASCIIHVADARRDQPTERASERDRAEEEAETLLALLSAVPHCEEIEAAGEHPRLHLLRQLHPAYVKRQH
jgi:hypothetical protein